MEQLKRIILPLLIFVVLVAALIFRLSSCTHSTGSGSSVASSVSGTAGTTGVASSSSPTGSNGNRVNYTNDDITRLFRKEGYAVKEIRDVGHATMVQFYTQDENGAPYISKFAWFDRATGEHHVVCDGVLADTFDILEDQTLFVRTTGLDFNNGMQWFPELFVSRANPGSETIPYSGGIEPYYMPIGQSVTISNDRPESLKSVTIDFDAVSVGFVPQPGQEGAFDVGFRYIPKTSVVTSRGFCYITFYNTTLAADFIVPDEGTGDGLRRFVSVTCDGTNTLLTLKLGERTAAYNIAMAYSPDDGMPYGVFKFRPEASPITK